ncbi:MAG: EamA family transporter, partial [Acidimicrobiia bacterium]
TLYIIIAHRVSRADMSATPVDRLGAAMLIAAIVITPIGLTGAISVFDEPMLMAAGIGVGLSSSVIPYAFDQMAMSRLPRATYALFVALLPASAVIIGLVVLRQIPTWSEVVAVGSIIGGTLIHQTGKETA